MFADVGGLSRHKDRGGAMRRGGSSCVSTGSVFHAVMMSGTGDNTYFVCFLMSGTVKPVQLRSR